MATNKKLVQRWKDFGVCDFDSDVDKKGSTNEKKNFSFIYDNRCN